jgi:hypothetical protein
MGPRTPRELSGYKNEAENRVESGIIGYGIGYIKVRPQ